MFVNASANPPVVNWQPTLTGRLLELRPLQDADFEALYAAARDPLIWKQHPETDRHTRPVFRRYFDTAMHSKGAFAVVERESGRVIGSSRYWNHDQETDEIEIGWTFLEREFWGGVYNRELKRLMLDHAFQFVARVVFVVGENNVRSRKAVEKIGGRYVRTIQRPDRHGTMIPNVVYAIERSPRSSCSDEPTR